jgi:SWI/SNF-related matrix-associated actin-dependent regulator of chromatin subfamily A3
LTVASRIHLIEPQWNPTIELQAIGRALRLGQKKQVTIVRYIIENTVEEVGKGTNLEDITLTRSMQYIQSRQTRKQQLANWGFGENEKDTVDDKLRKLNVSHHSRLLISTCIDSITRTYGKRWVCRCSKSLAVQ